MTWITIAFVGGYIASIYSWPIILRWVNGAQDEAERLREKAREIERKLGIGG